MYVKDTNTFLGTLYLGFLHCMLQQHLLGKKIICTKHIQLSH